MKKMIKEVEWENIGSFVIYTVFVILVFFSLSLIYIEIDSWLDYVTRGLGFGLLTMVYLWAWDFPLPKRKVYYREIK